MHRLRYGGIYTPYRCTAGPSPVRTGAAGRGRQWALCIYPSHAPIQAGRALPALTHCLPSCAILTRPWLAWPWPPALPGPGLCRDAWLSASLCVPGKRYVITSRLAGNPQSPMGAMGVRGVGGDRPRLGGCVYIYRPHPRIFALKSSFTFTQHPRIMPRCIARARPLHG